LVEDFRFNRLILGFRHRKSVGEESRYIQNEGCFPIMESFP